MKRPVVVTVVSLALLLIIAALVWPGIAQWLRLREARAALLRQPVYEVLQAHEPEVFERIAAKYAESRDDPARSAGFTNFASGELSVVASRRLARASDGAVLGLMRDVIANASTLAGQPGDECFRYLFPQVSGPPDVAHKLTPEAQARTFERVAEVIRSSAEAPAAPAEGNPVRDKLATLVNGFYEKYGADAQMIANAEDPRVDRAKVCTMTVALYEEIMAWPPADAAALIRLAAPQPGEGT